MAAQMLGSSTTTGTMPRVNLLPPEIAEKSALRRSQLAMAGVGLAAVAVVGVMYVNANGKVAEAEEAKAAAAAEGATLKSQLGGLQNVKETYAQVDTARATLAAAMANEVLWSGYFHDLTLTLPEAVWLTSFTATMSGSLGSNADPGAAAAASTAVLEPGVGSISIGGSALTHNDVAAWLESLAKQRGFLNPYFTHAEDKVIGNRIVVDFKSTVTLTPGALANRYSKGTAR